MGQIRVEQGEALDGARNQAPPPNGDPLVARVPVDVRSASLSILATLALVFLLHYAQEVFIPLVVALLISYALEPLVGWLGGWKLPRALGAALALVAFIGVLGGTIYYLRSGLTGVIDDMPAAARRLRRSLEDVRKTSPGAIGKVQDAAKEIEKAASAATATDATAGVTPVRVEQATFRASDMIFTGTRGAVILAGQLIIVVFLAFFLLASGNLYKRKLVRIVGPELYRKRLTVEILDEINDQIERFLVYMVLAAVIKGVATTVSLWWFGVENAASWGLIAGLLTPIPYLGPGIVVLGTAVAAYLQFDSVSMAA
jgi:predicted PurR-regulated permease PerM